MKCELITIYNVKTLSNKQLSFLDKSQAEKFSKGRGDWGGDLVIIPEQILIVDNVQYFYVHPKDQNELKKSINRAKIISRMNEDELKALDLV